jgi:hypothetical protein
MTRSQARATMRVACGLRLPAITRSVQPGPPRPAWLEQDAGVGSAGGRGSTLADQRVKLRTLVLRQHHDVRLSHPGLLYASHCT